MSFDDELACIKEEIKKKDEEIAKLKRELRGRKTVDMTESDRTKGRKWHLNRDKTYAFLVENGMSRAEANRVAFVQANKITGTIRLPEDLPEAVKEAIHRY